MLGTVVPNTECLRIPWELVEATGVSHAAGVENLQASQVLLELSVRGPHFENHRVRERRPPGRKGQ